MKRRIYRTAWRTWYVLPTEDGLRLFSGTSTVWNPNTKLVAKCWRKLEHKSPSWNCYCGIYGTFRREHVIRLPIVRGRCAFWGDTVVHQHGLRSQYAYPLSLTLNHDSRRLRLRCAICDKVLDKDCYYYWSKHDDEHSAHSCCTLCQRVLVSQDYLYFISPQALLRELLNIYGCDLEVKIGTNREANKESNIQS